MKKDTMPAQPVKVLVCGSRVWTNRSIIREWLAKLPPGSIVVHGAAPGADTLAGEEATTLGFEVRRYPADWTKHGNAAGPIRNQQMLDAEAPDVVFAFTNILARPNDRPTGTGDMVVRAVGAGVRCTIIPARRLDAQSLLAKTTESP